VSLAQRLGLLAAIIAVMLVLGTTELTLSWSAGSRLEDLRRESEALADTWAVYLNRSAPTGDSAAVAQALAAWPSQHLTATAAAVFTVKRGAWVRLAVTDPAMTGPDPEDRRAAVDRVMTVWREGEPKPAWRVSMPLGRGPPWGVLSVAVSTQSLEVQARSDRRRSYQIAFATAVLLGGVIWGLTRQWVGRPLADLEAAMDQTQERGPGATGGPLLPAGPAEFRRLGLRYRELERSLGIRERESEVRGELLAMEERARGLELVLMAEQAGAEFAHEIGTPLNTMRGHVQLLREDLARSGDMAGADRAEAILTQLNRVAGIVRAKLGEGSWPPVAARSTDLIRIARRMARFLEPVDRDGGPSHPLSIDPEVEGGLNAWCDPDLVEQILLNLLKNSAEATPDGGRISIGGERDGSNVSLEISDDGPGLPEEARRDLFEPFSTTKHASGGTGLGLTISRRLARAMGGDLVHVPTVRGTTWRLTLPARPDHLTRAS
jgi:signal transduction histidine kinase